MTTLVVAFRTFANAPKMEWICVGPFNICFYA